MTVHTCPRCHYKSKYKTHMKDHYDRVNICYPQYEDISIKSCKDLLNKKKSHKCDFCGKVFKRKDHLKKHSFVCKGLLVDKKVKEDKVSKKCSDIPGMVNIDGNNNTVAINSNNKTFNITINAYRNTNFDMLENNIKDCIMDDGKLDVKKMINYIHTDDPNNHNVYMANVNNKRIMKFEDGEFNEDGRNDNGIYKFLKEIANKVENNENLSNSDLYHLIENLTLNIDSRTGENFNKEDKEELERIKNETTAALIRARNIVLKTHKKLR